MPYEVSGRDIFVVALCIAVERLGRARGGRRPVGGRPGMCKWPRVMASHRLSHARLPSRGRKACPAHNQDLLWRERGAEVTDCGRGGRGRKLQCMRIERPRPQCPQTAGRGHGWVPSYLFLQGVTFDCLLCARNCGPLTIAEIVRWAASRGVTITPPFRARKSLSESWRYLEARFAAGKLTEAEIAEALERSIRRRSTRISVGIQRILLERLNRVDEGPRRFKSRSRRL